MGFPGTTKQSIFIKNSITSAWNQAISAVQAAPENIRYMTNSHSKEERFATMINMFNGVSRWMRSDPVQNVSTYEDLVGSLILGSVIVGGLTKAFEKPNPRSVILSGGRKAQISGRNYEIAIEERINKAGINTQGPFRAIGGGTSKEFDLGFDGFWVEAKSGNTFVNTLISINLKVI